MYLLSSNLFILFLHITNINCSIRSTMEEDIQRTDLYKIHKYEPDKVREIREKMQFDKKFPISTTIIHPFQDLLQHLENDVYRSMFRQIQERLNETQKTGSKILNDQLLKVMPPQVAQLDELGIPNTNSTHDNKLKVQRKLETTLPDDKQELEKIIQNVFRRLSDIYKRNDEVGINSLNRIYRPGYCYVFGVCSPIFCNCDKKDPPPQQQ